MRVTFSDGTVVVGGAALKKYCDENGLDWEYWRRRYQKGLARRKEGPRKIRLPDDWRARLDGIFGPEAVFEFVKEPPDRRPAILVTSNATDTRWGQALGHTADLMFCVRRRINMVDVETGAQLGSNPRGSIIWLYADSEGDMRRFFEALRPYGTALRKRPTAAVSVAA